MSVNDRLMKALEEYGGKTLNERIYNFLGSLGFTNSLSDRLAKYVSGRYRGYRALIEDFGRNPQPWGDLFAEGQSLHFDYLTQRYGSKSPIDGSITYTTNVNDLNIVTRDSAATYWGPEGSLLEAAVDEARIQHDPATGEALGLLIERSSTNLIATSDPTIDEYFYTPDGSTQAGPIGFLERSVFTPASGSGSLYIPAVEFQNI